MYVINCCDFNFNFRDKIMKLSKILSTSVAIGTLSFAANSFAVPTSFASQADTGAEFLNLTDLYSGGAADSFSVTDDLFLGADAFGIYEFTDVAGVISLGVTLEVLNQSTINTPLFGVPENKVNVSFNQVSGLATNDLTNATALIDSSFGLYAKFGADMVYSHASLNPGAADLVGIFDISSVSQDLSFAATFDNDQVEAYLTVGINDVGIIPEPSIVALFGLGLVGMVVATRRKQKQV
jgi:hypothetical protein